jgi:hypothetical protein
LGLAVDGDRFSSSETGASGVKARRCISAVIPAEKHFWHATGSSRQNEKTID